MNRCNHDFIKIQPLDPTGKSVFYEGGRKIVCVYCGQTRIVWENGVIEIIKEYGEVKWPNQYQSTSPT